MKKVKIVLEFVLHDVTTPEDFARELEDFVSSGMLDRNETVKIESVNEEA